jgi:hypothetical protein
MVEVYIAFVSKSGSDTNVRVPIGVIASSSPATVKVTSSPSASVAVTTPIAVWFSAALKVVSEVKTGAMSFTLVTLIVMSWVASLIPSETVTTAE